MKETIEFDMDAAIEALREGRDLSGQDWHPYPLDQTAHGGGHEGRAG